MRKYYTINFICDWIEGPFDKCKVIHSLLDAHDKLVAEGGNKKVLMCTIDDKLAYHTYVIEQALNIVI